MKSLASIGISDIDSIVSQMKAPFSHLSIENKQDLMNLINDEISRHNLQIDLSNSYRRRAKNWSDIEQLSRRIKPIVTKMEKEISHAFDKFYEPKFGEAPIYEAKPT